MHRLKLFIFFGAVLFYNSFSRGYLEAIRYNYFSLKKGLTPLSSRQKKSILSIRILVSRVYKSDAADAIAFRFLAFSSVVLEILIFVYVNTIVFLFVSVRSWIF